MMVNPYCFSRGRVLGRRQARAWLIANRTRTDQSPRRIFPPAPLEKEAVLGNRRAFAVTV